MAVTALTDDRVLFYIYSLYFGHRMTRKTITSAICHFGRIGRVTLDARGHWFMALIKIDVFE